MKRIFAKQIVHIIALALLIVAPVFAHASKKYALLVGVSAYPSLPEHFQLKGPPNDVALMQTILKQYGFDDGNVRVLADGMKGAMVPTRQAILSELTRLASQVKEGDFVYLHFSGHGSQQPTTRGKQPVEPDGLDEIFLPADVGKWDGSKGAVNGAIVDTEFGIAITNIRQRGAFVWAVFDSCHSGTMTRGSAGNDLRYRQIQPQDLGISNDVMTRAQTGSVQTRGAPQAKNGALGNETKLRNAAGGFVAFYAAQSSELAPEESLPTNQLDRKPFGTFTYTLAETLARNPNISYRQAGQQILNRYASRVMNSPTPLFEGSGLDAPIFGSTPGELRHQWKVKKNGQDLRIAAGALHQLADGAIFAVVPSPAAEDKEILGYLKAVNTKIVETDLEPIAYNKMAAPDISGIKPEAYIRLVNPNLSMALLVALPPAGNDLNHDKINRVLGQLMKGKTEGVRIKWVKPGQGADLSLHIEDNKLWLLPSSGAIFKSGQKKTHSIDLSSDEEKLTAALQASFRRIAKVINLLRLTTEMSTGLVAGAVNTTIMHQKADSWKRSVIKLGAVPSLKVKDTLFFGVTNNHTRAIDLTVLFVDSEYGITPVYPNGPGDANRIEAGAKQNALFELTLTGDTTGMESLIVIAVEATPQGATADFGFLAQSGLERSRGAGSEEQDDLFGMLSAGGTATTRGQAVSPMAAINKTMMRVFSWQTTK